MNIRKLIILSFLFHALSFPQQPNWFQDASGFDNIEIGLKKVGFNDSETNAILGNNWFNFYKNIN